MKWIKEHKYLTGFFVLILIVAVVVVVRFKRSANEAASNTGKLTKGDLVVAAYAIGTIRAEQTFSLKAGVSARVTKKFVRIGQHVKKGEPLLSLEGIDTYYAPFDGTISVLAYNLGEIVPASTVALTLVDMNSLYLELNMDERTIASVAPGQEARVSFEGQRVNPETAMRVGKVRTVYSADSQFYVVVDFDQKGMTLLPGMTSDVAIQVSVYKDKILAPMGAVGSGNTITLVGPKGEKTEVKTGISNGKYAIVDSPLAKTGDTVLMRVDPPSKRGGGPP